MLCVAAVLAGCGRNDANPVGAGLFNRRDLGGVAYLGPLLPTRKINAYEGIAPNRNGALISLAAGSLNRIDVTTLIRFTIPTDTILSASGGKDIRLVSTKVWLTQRPTLKVGSGQITVWQPRTGWDDQSVFADTTRGVEQPVSLDPLNSLVTNPGDSVTVITLPTSYVRDRLRITGRAAGGLDSVDVAIQGTPGEEFLAAWVATDALTEGASRPFLSITFLTSADSLQTINFIAARDTFYGTRQGGGPDSTALTVGTGLRYWTYMNFSLPESIPKRATINSARLDMDVIQSSTFPGSMVVTVDRLVINPTTKDTAYSQGVAQEILSGSTTFSANIGPFIAQGWTTGQATNDGIVIRPLSSPDLLSWIALRNPKLTITYSVPPGTE